MRKFSIRPICLGAILLCLLATSCKSERDQNGFVKIFDGESLEGWEGDPIYWKVEDGILVGEVTPANPLTNNSFLIWQGGELIDFELKGEFRITSKGNSGINYRSTQLDNIPFALKGYQADIDGHNRYTGQNYEERGRTTLAYRGEEVRIDPPNKSSGSMANNIKNNAWEVRTVTASLGNSDSLGNLVKKEEWNEIHLVLNDNRLKHYINGVLMSEVTDNDTVNRKTKGKLGLQLHVGPPMKVEYRNLRIKEL